MICPSCSATNPDTAQWCGQCLAPLAGPAQTGPEAGAVPNPESHGAHSLESSSGAASYASPTSPPNAPAQAYSPQQVSDATAASSKPGRSPVVLASAIAIAALLILGVGAFLFLGRGSAKTYSDQSMNFKVTSFKCGDKNRSVVEGQQGAVAHPRNLVAQGEFCTLQLDITSNLSASEIQVFAAESQSLLGPDGAQLEVNSVSIETISRPNNYYQPGPYPEIEPMKTVEAKVIWDYSPEVKPVAAQLRASTGSAGVRVPVD